MSESTRNVPCWTLHPRDYRQLLHEGRLRPGVVFESPIDPDRGSVIFIHGGEAAPSQFAPLAAALRDRSNIGALLYDPTARLAPAAAMLRAELLASPGPVVVVAYSLGALLPAYVGATDVDGRFRDVTAVYLNPLIGGSRYADADHLLAFLGEIPGLRWLHGVKRGIQRLFFPAVVRDLIPEGDFQQAIFGVRSRPPSFAGGTAILFTERPGEEPDIPDHRVRKHFGRSRRELIDRMGSVQPVDAARCTGHATLQAELVLPPLLTALGRAS